MSIVKFLSVGNGDLSYIIHNSDNFSIIDCCLPDDHQDRILEELHRVSAGKSVTRFISTHPDQDHICGLRELDDSLGIRNFYCVENACTKDDPTLDFDCYCSLRDSARVFHLSKGCSRKWMNVGDEVRGSAGLSVWWPDISHSAYQQALSDAALGECPNNISPIITYTLNKGTRLMWMGDLETEFMDEVAASLNLPQADVLFAPHHGRDSGRVPKSILDMVKPQLIVIGEAPAEHLNYYSGYTTIIQNSAGDITFDCLEGGTRIYASEWVDIDIPWELNIANRSDGAYIGTLYAR